MCDSQSFGRTNVGNLLLKSVYLVGRDSFQQLLQQVGAVGRRSRWFHRRRVVSEPADDEPQEKKAQTCQQVPEKNEQKGLK